MSAWIKRFLVLFFALFLVACGADEEGTSDDGAGDDPQVTSQGISLFSSGGGLETGPDNELEVTARVKNAQGELIQGVPVQFSLDDSGANFRPPQGEDFTTDQAGSARALISSPSDPTNRSIQVTASVNGVESEPLQIEVRGTSIEIEAPPSGSPGQLVDVAATLTDAQGNGISGETLSFSAGGNAAFTPAEATTNPQGRVETEFAVQPGSSSSSNTITVEGAGASATTTLSISPEQLNFSNSTTDPLTEINLNDSQDFTVTLQDAAGSPVGQQIDFFATRGFFSPDSSEQTSDVAGEAQATVTYESGKSAGPAIITAEAPDGAIAKKEVLLVATNPTSINLQIQPSNVAPGEEAQLTAVVRNTDNQPVKGQRVNFSFTSGESGGTLTSNRATTDAFGRATTTFRAGETSGATDGTVIQAKFGEAASEKDTASVTVAGAARSISIGQGDTISTASEDTRYVKKYIVVVTDSSGGPVANAEVSVSAVPVEYFKGTYGFVDPTWQPSYNATCANEDSNLNNQLDKNEDVNGNGVLDPRVPLTVSPSTVQTDDSGFATFELSYPQNYATWLKVALIGETQVAGTESTGRTETVLNILNEDATDEENRPAAGDNIPFGSAGNCADPS